MKQRYAGSVLALILISGAIPAHGEGDARRGAEAFRHCIACHSLEPGRHLTGPSLAGIHGRKAGTASGFRRYSKALEGAGISWNEQTLDRWLESPDAVVPGTSMRIRGITDAAVRLDLIAFLKSASETGGAGQAEATPGRGMMGGMRGGRMLHLREPTPQQRVTAIGHCGDAYHVTLGSGGTFTFWEFNLRFKTDSSRDGPQKGAPAIVRAGMQGDRAQVVFADPAEMSAFIKTDCEAK